MGFISRIHEYRSVRQLGDSLPQEMQLLADDLRPGDPGQASDVRAGPGEAGNESGTHRIDDGHHHDGDRLRRVLDHADQWRRGAQDDIDLEIGEFPGKLGQPFILSVCPAILKADGLTIDPANARAGPAEGLRSSSVPEHLRPGPLSGSQCEALSSPAVPEWSTPWRPKTEPAPGPPPLAELASCTRQVFAEHAQHDYVPIPYHRIPSSDT